MLHRAEGITTVLAPRSTRSSSSALVSSSSTPMVGQHVAEEINVAATGHQERQDPGEARGGNGAVGYRPGPACDVFA
ncbi:MAG TPA: hypothetical protein VE197_04890 [Mycobacterium sp.]|nr:hypothetical protein [Mycobacterium sp.]